MYQVTHLQHVVKNIWMIQDRRTVLTLCLPKENSNCLT